MLPIQMLCTVQMLSLILLPCTSDSSSFLVIALVVITEEEPSRVIELLGCVTM